MGDVHSYRIVSSRPGSARRAALPAFEIELPLISHTSSMRGQYVLTAVTSAFPPSSPISLSHIHSHLNPGHRLNIPATERAAESLIPHASRVTDSRCGHSQEPSAETTASTP